MYLKYSLWLLRVYDGERMFLPYDNRDCHCVSSRSLLACHPQCKRSMETTRNSVKVKLGIQAMKLVKSLIGSEVTVTGRGSECHLALRERETSYCWIRSPFRPWNFLNDDLKRSRRYPCFHSLLICALPITTNVTSSTSISQTFRSRAATFHLRQPMAFLSHSSYGMPGLVLLMNVLF